MDKQGFFRHAFVYGLANLILQAGGVVLLPLYTRCLSPADYGVLEVLGRLAETVGTCLLFGGFRQALGTFYQQASHEDDRRRIVSTTLGMFALTCLLGGGPVLALATPIGGWLSAALDNGGTAIDGGLLRLAVLAVLLEPLTLIPLTLVQARMESTTFVAVTLTQFLVRVALCVMFVAVLGWGVTGVLTANALTAGLYGVALSLRELGRGRGRPNPAQVRSLLRFALPFIPGGLCFFLLHHGDRFFLLRWSGPEEVGLYALGYKLAMAVSMFSLTPLYMVWSTRMYAVAREPDGPWVFGRAFTRILAAYLAVGLGLCLFQDEVVALIAGPAYAGATLVVPPVVLACFCQAGASLMDAGFYVRRRTGLKLGITLAATAVMLVLYVVLIPTHGSLGAALATLGGFAFLAVCTWWVTQRIFPVHYEWPRVGALVLLTVGLWLASRLVPAGGWGVAAKAGLWLSWPLVAWQAGLISHAERRYTAELTRQTVARLRGAAARVRRPRTAPAPCPQGRQAG
jgi:O-antigen/teichoic acid export membrane protein